jgi:putative spermidine/putrescine transport system ATP-binding protein
MPGHLSGGQEQRVSLARALAANPRILLLDEPFNSLDSRLKEDMYDLVGQIRSRLEPTIVLVTHDRREASVLADTIAVLSDGAILQHGPVPQLHYQPVSRTVNRIMGGLNELPGVVTDGFHSSALGRVRVQQGQPDGPATLLIRQEAIRISPQIAGATSGTVTVMRSMGANVLVRVRVESAGDSGSIAVEMAGAPALRIGERVGVTLPDAQGWAVTA